METKICNKCGLEKNIEEFRKQRNQCRQCERNYTREYRHKNYEKCLEKSRIWKLNNKEKIKEYNKRRKKYNYEITTDRKIYMKKYMKKWREKNKEHIKEYKRNQYRKLVDENPELMKQKTHSKYEKNKKKILESNKKWKEKNREKYLKSLKEYYIKNQDKIKAYREKYRDKKRKIDRVQQKLKRSTDSVYKLKIQIRNRINCCIKRKGYNKNSKTEQIIGCDYKTFINYLLNTYKNNYGCEWDGKEKVHIDHIVPLATATTEEEVIKLNRFSNLQLLKAKDNLHKSSKLEWKLE